MMGGKQARLLRGSAGPCSSGTAFTSTENGGVTPTSRTDCENEGESRS
uniref:Uncharacterized protein n=1 Tax=Anguilla anguilla TaxID=7936 RepID=A0A0E9U0E6_ANGAN